MEEEGKDPKFVTALARGLEVLRCFSAERQELGTTDIARMTGLAQSTVWRLCYTLSTLGYLVPGLNPDRLRVGAGVLMLGHAAITHTGLAEFALPLMTTLADRYGLSVSLGQRHRDSMVIVQRSEAAGILRVNLHVGASLDLINSSLGWAYLAAIPEEQRTTILGEIALARPEDWKRRHPDVHQAIKDYRRHGYVFNLGKSHPDINAIGVPIVSTDGSNVMALTCGGSRSQLTRDAIVTSVSPEMLSLAAKLAPMLPAATRL